MTRIIRNLCILIFVCSTFAKVYSQGLFNAILVDMNNKGTFPYLSDLSICGKQDTLAVTIAALEDTVLITNIKLMTTLPTGYVLSGYAQIFKVNLDTLDAHPNEPATNYMVPVTQSISDPSDITFTSNLNPREVFVVYLGVKATCGANLLTTQYVNYELSYQRWSILGVPLSQNSFQINGETPINNYTRLPELVIYSQGTPPTVYLGQTVHRKVVILQSGLLASLDSIYYKDIASAIQIVPSSVTVNGISVTSPNVTTTGMSFPIKASTYDLNQNFYAGDSIVVEYDIIASCPIGQTTSSISASWGCVPTGTCQTANSNYSFIVDLGANLNLASSLESTPYSCEADTGLFKYYISNISTYQTGLDTNATIHNMKLEFDTRSCGIFQYNKFYIEYKGGTIEVVPTIVNGSKLTFDIAAALSSIDNSTNGILYANDSVILNAYYSSNCNSSCTVSCNDCRQPYIKINYYSKCAKVSTQEFHKLPVGSDGMKALGLIPCGNINVSLNDEAQVGACEAGFIEYMVDISALQDTIDGFIMSLSKNGCAFYNISDVLINGVSVPFTLSGGNAVVNLQTNTTAIPNFLDQTSTFQNFTVRFIFDYASNTLGCSYPTFKIDKYGYCQSEINSVLYPNSGYDVNQKYELLDYNNSVFSTLIDEKVFGRCESGYFEYETQSIYADSIGNLVLCLDVNSCDLYQIDSILVNGILIPNSLTTIIGSQYCVNLSNIDNSLATQIGFLDNDGDGFLDETPTSFTTKFYTSLNPNISNFNEHCVYPDFSVAFDICSAYRDTSYLDISGKTIADLISLASLPSIKFEALEPPYSIINPNTGTSTLSFCSNNTLSYLLDLDNLDTIYDLNIYLSEGTCTKYSIDQSKIYVGGVLISSSSVSIDGSGNIVVNLSNQNNIITGFIDADGDGFTDDINQNIIITLQLNPSTVGTLGNGDPICCSYPLISGTYNQCPSYRDSVSIPFGSFPFESSNRICIPSSRNATTLSYLSYTGTTSCGLDYMNYRVQLPSGIQYDTLSEIKLILDSRGCNLYDIDTVFINGTAIGASILQNNGGVYTATLNNNVTPISSFFDGLDVDGNIDATNNTINVSWQVNRLGFVKNTCLFPTFKVCYSLCGSDEFCDSLRYSGRNVGDIINLPNLTESIVSVNNFTYTAPSYCSEGYIDYVINVSAPQDTIGGFKFRLDALNCDFYEIDHFEINGVSVPNTYLSVNPQRVWTLDLTNNVTPIPGLFNSNKDADIAIDEFNSTLNIRAVINLQCQNESSSALLEERGVSGTSCTAYRDMCYRPDAYLIFDRCFGETGDSTKNCDGSTNSSSLGTCSIPNELRTIMIYERRGVVSGSGFDYLHDNVSSTVLPGGNLHTLVYDYTHFGIAECPNDTQLVLKVCMDYAANKRHADSMRLYFNSSFFGTDFYHFTHSITPEQYLSINPGYLGHILDTSQLVSGGDSIVCLTMYLTDVVHTPVSGTNDLSIKFVTNSYGPSYSCYPYPVTGQPMLGWILSKDLTYTCRQDDGSVCCEFKRSCRGNIAYYGGSRAGCLCLVEQRDLDVTRISAGYDDNTLSSRANPTDNLDIQANCDTVRVTTKVSFNFDTVLNHFTWVYDQYAPGGAPRYNKPLDYLAVDTAYIVTVTGIVIPIPESCISRITTTTTSRVIDTFRLDYACLGRNVFKDDSMYLSILYKVNTNNAQNTCLSDQYNGQYNYTFRYSTPAQNGQESLIRYNNDSTMIIYQSSYNCDLYMDEPYSIIHYNNDRVDAFASHKNVSGCKINLSSHMLNSCVTNIGDVFPNEFRPQYFLDSIVLNIEGLNLDTIAGQLSIKIPSGASYVIGSTLGDIITVTHPTTTSTRIVLSNTDNNWPIKEISTFLYDTIYSLELSLEYNGCCYKIEDDAYFNVNYFYKDLPFSCSPRVKTAVDSIEPFIFDNFGTLSDVDYEIGCKGIYMAALRNTCSGSNNDCYPIDPTTGLLIFVPTYNPDSIIVTIPALADSMGTAILSNSIGGTTIIGDVAGEIVVEQDIVNNVTYIKLYDINNDWPIIHDTIDFEGDLLYLTLPYTWEECCFTYNKTIDTVEIDWFYTSLSAGCTQRTRQGQRYVQNIEQPDMMCDAQFQLLKDCQVKFDGTLTSDVTYANYIDPQYFVDSIVLVIEDNNIDIDETSMIIKVPHSSPFSVQPSNVTVTQVGGNTIVTIINDGSWPILQDTFVSSDTLIYQYSIIGSFTQCCYEFTPESYFHNSYYISDAGNSSICVDQAIKDTTDFISSESTIDFLVQESLSNLPDCRLNIKTELQHECPANCYDTSIIRPVYSVDSIVLTIQGSAMDTCGAIFLNTLEIVNFEVPSSDITVSTIGTTTVIKLSNGGTWPNFVDSAWQNGLAIYSVDATICYAGCCYTFEEGATVSTQYYINSVYTNNCKKDTIEAIEPISSLQNLGGLSSDVIFEQTEGCLAVFEASVFYECQQEPCYPSSIFQPSYILDSIKFFIEGALLSPITKLYIDSAGVPVDSIAESNFIVQTIGGNTVVTVAYPDSEHPIIFDANNVYSYRLAVLFKYEECYSLSDIIDYNFIAYYHELNAGCFADSVQSIGQVALEGETYATIDIYSGFSNPQYSYNGDVEWVYDVCKEGYGRLLWTAFKASSGLSNFVVDRLDENNGNVLLYNLPLVDLGSNQVMVHLGDTLSCARIRVRANVEACVDQTIDFRAGVTCFEYPSNISNDFGTSGGMDSVCYVVAKDTNYIQLAPNAMQSTFYVDPTFGGIDLCDTLEFVFVVKNTQNGYTFYHNIDLDIPDAYTQLPGTWGFQYPFNEVTDTTQSALALYSAIIDPTGVPIIGNPGVSRYSLSMSDLSMLLFNEGLPGAGIQGFSQDTAQFAIKFKVATSCGAALNFERINAKVTAQGVCTDSTLISIGTTAQPIVGGIDFSQLNTFQVSPEDANSFQSSPTRKIPACTGKPFTLGYIFQPSLPLVQPQPGEKLCWTLPPEIHYIPQTGIDSFGFDYSLVEISSLAGGYTEVCLPLPQSALNPGLKPRLRFYIDNSAACGQYLLPIGSRIDATIDCKANTDGVDSCKISLSTGSYGNDTLVLQPLLNVNNGATPPNATLVCNNNDSLQLNISGVVRVVKNSFADTSNIPYLYVTVYADLDGNNAFDPTDLVIDSIIHTMPQPQPFGFWNTQNINISSSITVDANTAICPIFVNVSASATCKCGSNPIQVPITANSIADEDISVCPNEPAEIGCKMPLGGLMSYQWINIKGDPSRAYLSNDTIPNPIFTYNATYPTQNDTICYALVSNLGNSNSCTFIDTVCVIVKGKVAQTL
jgi:hypothetical protein